MPVTTPIDGGDDQDLATGGLGADTVDGGAGNDSVAGGEGDDVVRGGTGADVVSGQDGNDQLFGGEGDDTLIGASDGAGNDTLDGGEGVDTATYTSSTEGIAADLVAGTVHGNLSVGVDAIVGVENLVASDFDDTVTGDAQSNMLDLRNGADSATGGAGDDTLLGGSGNDTWPVVRAMTRSTVAPALTLPIIPGPVAGSVSTLLRALRLTGQAAQTACRRSEPHWFGVPRHDHRRRRSQQHRRR